MKTISTKDFSSLINVSPHLIYKLVKEHDLDVIPQGNRNALPPETVRNILELSSKSHSVHVFNKNRIMSKFKAT